MEKNLINVGARLISELHKINVTQCISYCYLNISRDTIYRCDIHLIENVRLHQ